MAKLRVFALAISLAALTGAQPSHAEPPEGLLQQQLAILDRLAQGVGAAGSGTNLNFFPMPANDLDGDGRADILVQTGYIESNFEITALKGNTGTTLWTRTLSFGTPEQTNWHFAIPARVGPAGQNGVLAIETLADGIEESLHMAALSADGEVLWRRSEQGGLSLGIPVLFDVLHANGAADDMLIGWVDSLYELRIERLTAAIVSGETGSIRDRTSVIAFDGRSRAIRLGDLTQDGLEDFAIITSEGDSTGMPSTTIRTYRGTDGSRLWTAKPPGAWINDWIIGVPDVTGDERDEVIVGRSPTYPPSPNISLLDGGDGSVVWDRDAGWVIGADDVDGNGLADVMTLNYSFSPAPGHSTATLRFRAIDVAGNDLYSTMRTVSFPTGGSSPCVGWTHPGDVNADHRTDFIYHVWGDCRTGGATESGVVSGASGAVLWARQRIDVMLDGAVDGLGNDVALQSWATGLASFSVFKGSDGTSVWSASVPASQPWYVAGAFALDVDADGRADVMPVISGGPLTMLRGTDGSVLWSR